MTIIHRLLRSGHKAPAAMSKVLFYHTFDSALNPTCQIARRYKCCTHASYSRCELCPAMVQEPAPDWCIQDAEMVRHNRLILTVHDGSRGSPRGARAPVHKHRAAPAAVGARRRSAMPGTGFCIHAPVCAVFSAVSRVDAGATLLICTGVRNEKAPESGALVQLEARVGIEPAYTALQAAA